MIRDNVSFFLFEQEKTYLITSTSEILPLFLLKEEKDKANVRQREKERENDISLFLLKKKRERIKKKRKQGRIFFSKNPPVEYRRLVLIIISIIRC